MRDYKFRGWSTDFNKWIYGYACFSPNKERSVIIHKQAGNDMQHTDVVPESVGEYSLIMGQKFMKVMLWITDIIELL